MTNPAYEQTTVGYNRTYVELKQDDPLEGETDNVRYNRTYVELKLYTEKAEQEGKKAL